jgi:glycosyltransferase involved in cell wall biosynthesis
VGWVGRLTTIKAPELFLDCAGLIYGQSPNTRFAMIGDGELRHDCEDRIQQLGLSRSVRLRGWQRHLAPIYADIDLLLLTSLNEGTPLALVEAMASGRPFIATDVGAVRDLMTGVMRKEQGWQRFDNGILVPRDARVMAQAAHFLLANPELRREMGLAGREFVRTRYSQDRLADELESLYLRLAESKKTSRDLLPLTISPATVSSGDGTSSHG